HHSAAQGRDGPSGSRTSLESPADDECGSILRATAATILMDINPAAAALPVAKLAPIGRTERHQQRARLQRIARCCAGCFERDQWECRPRRREKPFGRAKG